MFFRFSLGFKKLYPFLKPILLTLTFTLVSTCLIEFLHADNPQDDANGDVHLAIVPIISAIRDPNGWDSESGIDLGVAYTSPATLSVAGLSAGASIASGTKALQLHMDVFAGTKLIGDVDLGLSAGPLLRFEPNKRMQVGVRVGLWLRLAVAPYLSIAQLGGSQFSGTQVELGVKLPIPLL